eukprot:Awhi_evm1s2412
MSENNSSANPSETHHQEYELYNIQIENIRPDHEAMATNHNHGLTNDCASDICKRISADKVKSGTDLESGLEAERKQISTSETHSPFKRWKVTEEKIILKKVNGFVRSGEVMAILGPSGSGKSSLLDTLALQTSNKNHGNQIKNGDILYNGRDVVTRSFFEKNCAYVQQSECLWTNLTVRESLSFAGTHSYKQYPELSKEEFKTFMNERVEETIHALGLSNCADTLVGNVFVKGLSGGQKRRLSIGIALLKSSLKLLFLDEPTSGLDSCSAGKIMELIQSLARKMNIIVIASIHQPSTQTFFHFDRILLLTKGHTAYFGTTDKVIEYFNNIDFPMPHENMSPADHLLAVTNSDFVDPLSVGEIIKKWPESKNYDRLVSTIENQKKETLMEDDQESLEKQNKNKEFLVLMVRKLAIYSWDIQTLCSRMFTEYRRDRAGYLGRIILFLIMGLFLGTAYINEIKLVQQDVISTFTFQGWCLAFFTFMNMLVIPSFSVQFPVILKEIKNGQYQVSSFVVASTIVHSFMILMITLAAVIPSYWISGLRPESRH